MRVTFFRREKSFKIVSLLLAAGFLTTSVHAAGENLRPSAVKNSDRLTFIANELKKDGGIAAAAAVDLYAENTFIGDAAKGSDVGRVVRLGKLIEEKIVSVLLGHSANRKAYIKEISAQIAQGLRLTGMEEQAALATARKIAFSRYDTIMNHRILAMLKADVKKICLCVGSDKDKLTVEEEISDVIAQLDVSFADVALEQINNAAFQVAWEPAANIGTGTAVGPEKIKLVHQAIYNWFSEKYNTPAANIDEVWGKSLKILYGASVDGKNVEGIMAVKSDKGIALVHGVLFASSGKKADGFLAVAEGVSRAAVRDNAVYVCFVNLKEFTRKEKDSAEYFISEIAKAIATGKVNPANTIMAIADQDIHLKEWQNAIAAASPASVMDGGFASVEETNFKGKNVVFRPDNNTPASVKTDDQGNVVSIKISDPSRIIDSFPSLLKILKDKPQRVVIVVHFEPKVLNPLTDKKEKKNLSTKVIADKYKELLPEEYKGKVVYLADSVNENGITAQALKAIDSFKDSEIVILENIRFAKGEKKGDPTLNDPKGIALRDQLSGMADEYVVDALGNIHRAHASMLPKRTTHKVIGKLIQKETSVFNRVLDPAHPYVSANGGNKVEDKVDTIKVALSTMNEQDAILIGGAMAYTFLKAQNPDLRLGNSLIQADKIELAKEILAEAAQRKVKIILPVDHRISDKLVAGAAEKVTEGLEVPEGYMAVDIGPKTEALFAEALGKAQTALWNGPMGAFEDEVGGFNKGTFAVARGLQKLGQAGGLAVIGGGETRMAALKAGVSEADGVFMSSGGGATQEYIAKKGDLFVIKNLENDKEAQANLVRAEKLGVAVSDLVKFDAADNLIYNALGKDVFSGFIAKIKNMLPRIGEMPKLNGDLSKVQLGAESIKDSRGKATVRATLKIGDIVTVGEVPAGASKGQDEAFAFPPEEINKAIANVGKIQGILQKSGLDISKYGDLRRAEQMIIEAAGDNFTTLGANATVPVSWALWRMAAALNNMELWEYIRANEPEAIGNDPVYFYMNIFNGGLHASGGDASLLGKVWVEIQEMLIVPVGDITHAEGKAMGDNIDQELKKILKGKFAEASIQRKDEAGFAVKGLGKSEDAIAYVVQAIVNAGYRPGVDVKLALDVAASSFFDEDANVYNFQGKKLTSDQMVEFYVRLTEQYKGLFISIEDGLAENDWQGWVKLTAAMKEKGILTIGDDLFVTQHGRLNKGLAMKAATAILIKVNQNGTLGGTIDVMKTAKANGIKAVVSHRSGETLDSGIADLAYATKALGLKTGDPQPLVDFTDSSKLVRRAKYDRMIQIQESEANKNNPALNKPKALLVSAKLFKSTAIKNALAEAAKLSGNLNIIIYGDNSEKMKALVGDVNIIAAKDLDEGIAKIGQQGVILANAVILVSKDAKAEYNGKDIRKIVSSDVATVGLAKALKELFPTSDVKTAFGDFYKQLADENVISDKTYADTREVLLAELAKSAAFDLSETVKMSSNIALRVDEAVRETADFMTKV
jgi:enolase